MQVRAPARPKLSNCLEGLTIVVTGDIFQKVTRPRIERIITSLGARNTGSVSNRTDFLVYGDYQGNKYKDA